MGQITTRLFTDSHVRADMPDRSFHISHLLRVSGQSRPDWGRAFLWMPRPFPLGVRITSATLRLRTRDVVPGTVTMRLRRVAHSHVITEATWNRQPTVRDDVVASDATLVDAPDGAVWEFDVATHMQAIANGSSWWGWRLGTTTNDAAIRVQSADSDGLGPELTVVWSDAPSPPTDLTPSGGQVVSVPRPVLSYSFVDVSGDTTLSRTRIQINGEPVQSGTVLWDRTLDTTDPVIDLAATDAPPVGLGFSMWWRALAIDGAGEASRWSEWAQWRRIARPVVKITSPVGGGTVEDPSPVVTWALTSGSQASYQVMVWNADRSQRLWHSGRVVSSTVRSHQVPAGVLARDDTDYRVEVRIWDNHPRVHAPGDPEFSDDRIVVTFDRDGSLTPVAMGVYPTRDQVGMVLSWTRPVDAGSWIILRDGQIIAQVDSADVVAEGEWWRPLQVTTPLAQDTLMHATQGWTWVDWRADPRRDHTWEVAPVVNGHAGRGDEVVHRLEPVGVWLVRPQTGERVMVTGDDTPSGWGMVEQSTSHLPLGSRRPVLITQGMGGYQGQTSGFLSGLDHGFRGVKGPTAQEQRDTFLRLKERQGQTMRLVLADQNLPVTCWGMTVAPAPAGPHLRFAVSWSWAQVDEFDYTPHYL